MGPFYCETPAFITGFPAEPINTYSNLIIIAFGLLALFIVHRKSVRTPDLYALGIFLLATGIGSLLWHSLRSSWALALDVLPGIIFLILFVYGWSRRLFGVIQSTLVVLGFFISIGLTSVLVVSFTVTDQLVPFFAGPVLISILFGLWLGALSWKRWGMVTWFVFGGIFSALIAFVFRTIDLSTCSTISFGTHFLWHVFLSFGALLCIHFLLFVDEKSS